MQRNSHEMIINCVISGNGRCDTSLQRCVCAFGFAGADCSLEAPANQWFSISPSDPNFTPRLLHTACYDDVCPQVLFDPPPFIVFQTRDAVFAFGGRTLTSSIDDLAVFSFAVSFPISSTTLSHIGQTLTWSPMFPTGPSPEPRDSHTAAIHQGKMYIYGGKSNMTILNDLWALDLSTNTWQKISPTFCDFSAGLVIYNSLVMF